MNIFGIINIILIIIILAFALSWLWTWIQSKRVGGALTNEEFEEKIKTCAYMNEEGEVVLE